MSVYRIKGASGAVINQSTTLGERTVIGTSADCDVVIEIAGGTGALAEIVRNDDGLLLRALDAGVAVRVNGEEISEQPLGSGDEILVGQLRWVLQAPGLKPQRVLHGAAVKRSAARWPWVFAALLAAAGGAAWWAWQQGYLLI